MAWKTRKNRRQRGGSLAKLFSKKKNAPLASKNTVETTLANNVVTYQRKGSEANFVTMKKKKANVASKLRNHVKKLKSVSPETRNESFKLMNATLRDKMKTLLNFPSFNSLNNDQVVELYTTGKVRSKSV